MIKDKIKNGDKIDQTLLLKTNSKAAENSLDKSQQCEFPLSFTFK
jgi:hypothetical protein